MIHFSKPFIFVGKCFVSCFLPQLSGKGKGALEIFSSNSYIIARHFFIATLFFNTNSCFFYKKS